MCQKILIVRPESQGERNVANWTWIGITWKLRMTYRVFSCEGAALDLIYNVSVSKPFLNLVMQLKCLSTFLHHKRTTSDLHPSHTQPNSISSLAATHETLTVSTQALQLSSINIKKWRTRPGHLLPNLHCVNTFTILSPRVLWYFN